MQAVGGRRIAAGAAAQEKGSDPHNPMAAGGPLKGRRMDGPAGTDGRLNPADNRIYRPPFLPQDGRTVVIARKVLFAGQDGPE